MTKQKWEKINKYRYDGYPKRCGTCQFLKKVDFGDVCELQKEEGIDDARIEGDVNQLVCGRYVGRW